MMTEAIYRDGILEPKRPLKLANQSLVQVQVMDQAATEHPHIMKMLDVQGGRPVVRGTRIQVKTLVRYYHMGMTVSEILAGYPDLTAAQFYDALSYYYDNQAEVEADIEADEQENILSTFELQVDRGGRLIPAKK